MLGSLGEAGFLPVFYFFSLKLGLINKQPAAVATKSSGSNFNYTRS
jgi:hypothetical protein